MKIENNIAELRKQLKALFEQVTRHNYELSGGKNFTPVLDKRTDALFHDAWDTTIDMIKKYVKITADDTILVPPKEYYDILEELFAFPLCHIYDSYKVREDVTDEEIASHAEAIRKQDVDKLEDLRDQNNRRSYEMPLEDAYYKLHSLYLNVKYALMLYAHQAKFLGSREGAMAFLRAASQLERCDHPQRVYFSDEQIDTIITEFRKGVDEMLLQVDYRSLADWPEYRERQEKIVEESDRNIAKKDRK